MQTSTLHPKPQILPISLGLIPVFCQAQDLVYAKDFMFDFGQVISLERNSSDLTSYLKISYLKLGVYFKLSA